MIRGEEGKLVKINKENFKNDYDYYRFLWKRKHNIKINKKISILDSIKKLVK